MSDLSFALIHSTVKAFYKKAVDDILIGFHFNHIDDLDAHIERISYFWQLQLTGKIEKNELLPFNLIEVHRPMKLTSGMVDRWIVLFHQTLYASELTDDQKSLWKKKIELFRERMKSIQIP